MSSAGRASIFTFDTTTHAMWAEEVAGREGVPAEVIPAPADAGAKCDLALRTLPERVGELAGHLRREGIEFRLYGDGVAGPG